MTCPPPDTRGGERNFQRPYFYSIFPEMECKILLAPPSALHGKLSAPCFLHSFLDPPLAQGSAAKTCRILHPSCLCPSREQRVWGGLSPTVPPPGT